MNSFFKQIITKFNEYLKQLNYKGYKINVQGYIYTNVLDIKVMIETICLYF